MFRSLSIAVLGVVLILQSPQTVQAQTTQPASSTQEELKQAELRLENEVQRIQNVFQLFQTYHPDIPATLRTEIEDTQVYVYLGGPAPAQEKLKAFLLSPPQLHLKVRKPQANAPWIELGPVEDWMALPAGMTREKSCMELKAMGIKNIQKVDRPLQELSLELEFLPEDRPRIKALTSHYLGKTIGVFIDGQLISSPTITYAIDSVSSTLSIGNYANEKARDWAQKLQAHPEGLTLKEKTPTGWAPIQASITLQSAKARGVLTSLAWLELVFKDSDRAQIKTFTSQNKDKTMGFFFEDKLLASPNISGGLDSNVLPLDGHFTLDEAKSLEEKIKAHPESLQLKLQNSNDWVTVLEALTLLDVKTKEPEPAPPGCTTTDEIAFIHKQKALAMVPYANYTWGLFDKTSLRYDLLPLKQSPAARLIPLNNKQEQKAMLTAWSQKESQAPFKIKQLAP